MMFDPITRTSTSSAVFDQIATRVLDGELSAGATLPSERQLAEAFGVSRPVVREAVQKLSQAGLIDIRHGESTSIRDYRRSAGPELLGKRLVREGVPDWSVARSVLEARQSIGVNVAGLAALRATPESVRDLRAALPALIDSDDPVALQMHALTFWECVVDGADSIAFRLIFNSLRHAYEPTMTALAATMVAEVGRSDLYEELAGAISRHDSPAAESTAATLLGLGTDAIATVIDHLEQSSDTMESE